MPLPTPTHLAALASTLVALGATGCSGSATAKLRLENQSTVAPASRQARLVDGTSLRIKLLGVSIAEDVDPVTLDNRGAVSNVWLNPQCGGDNDTCNIDGMAGGPAGPRVTEYFDFARSSDAVNADLNSQARDVEPGTYRYARITFCKAYDGQTMPTLPTLMWAGAGMADEVPFASGDCGRTSLPFDPPLELKAGDAVEVSLGYDLGQAVVVGAPDPASQHCSLAIAGHADQDGTPHCFRACVELDPSTRACMDFPDFAPTARKL
jgi:hypothetical protein